MARQNTDDRSSPARGTRAAERRRHERVSVQLALSVGGADGTVMSQSINISQGGVYFQSDHAIDVETMLSLTLVLPPTAHRSAEHAINVSGVVVRCEPESGAGGRNFYSVACFFTDVSDTDRAVLEDYISARSSRTT
jgi:hypothetical protein